MGGTGQPGGGDGGVRVVCVGETMLMLAPPPHELLEYCDHLVVYNGGAESNVAIGLERLGVHAGWIGKVPRSALGRKVVNGIRSFGVDTSAVVWTEGGRVGLFFVEWGAPPRPLSTIYDRCGSAAAELTADDLDWDYVGRADWLVLTGITPALSPTCREATVEMARRARERGVRVALDVNYRALLWTRDIAAEAIRSILPYVNLLVATEPDMRLVADGPPTREEVLAEAVGRYGLDAATMTLGSEGALAHDGREYSRAPGHRVRTVNRLGAGDAFLAGLLYGYLRAGLPMGLRYGLAMSALKMTIPQNVPLVNAEDVHRLADGEDIEQVR